EEVVKEVRNPQDFSTLRVFQVAQEEIVVRQEPSIESEILKYLVEGEELIVVDKVKDEYGEEWYVVRLFDYDMTYGFTVTSNLRYVREIEVKIEGNTEGGFESDE
ncbi:MAG: SH3 domain-containing protein, partial [Spirochaetales bacterium]|nr:SH3 domain-containing protein [Spirochaetales bacterium]